eukprot:6502531-Prymnesium_polylepis.1
MKRVPAWTARGARGPATRPCTSSAVHMADEPDAKIEDDRSPHATLLTRRVARPGKRRAPQSDG